MSHALTALAAADVATPKRAAFCIFPDANMAGDLAARLSGHGFTAERRVAYAAASACALPAPLQDPCDFVLFHSARAAWRIRRSGRAARAGMRGCCLSERSPTAAANAAWTRIIVAPNPREDALLGLPSSHPAPKRRKRLSQTLAAHKFAARPIISERNVGGSKKGGE